MASKDEIFLIDSNTLVAPNQQYYPFDMAPGFWDQMKECIETGRIIIASIVFDEVKAGSDDLSKWIDQFKSMTFDHKDKDIVIAIGEILDFLRNSPKYSSAAVLSWSDIKIADPWLIAIAKTYEYTVVTFEKSSNSPNKPKIPDICDHFGVKYCDLFKMMRALSFSLGR